LRQNGSVKRRTRVILVVGLMLVVALVVLGSVRGNQVNGQLGGRTIVAETAHVLHRAELVLSEPVATVTLGDLSAAVTPESVELPDGSVPIPATCHKIELRERDGRIRVKLDGVEAN
jgi:hypothetical protein